MAAKIRNEVPASREIFIPASEEWVHCDLLYINVEENLSISKTFHDIVQSNFWLRDRPNLQYQIQSWPHNGQ